MDSWPVLQDLLVALGLGLLIGVERGWRSRAEAAGSRVAGLRTFGLLGMLGGVAGILFRSLGALTAAVVIAFTILALCIGYLRDMRADGNVSVTSFATAVLTLCLGVLATNGYAFVAVAVAALVTLLLASRTQLHGWLRGMSEADVQATARFAIIAAVVLPLLPNQSFGPTTRGIHASSGWSSCSSPAFPSRPTSRTSASARATAPSPPRRSAACIRRRR